MSCPSSGPCQPFASSLDLCCLVSGGFQDPCLTSGQPVPQSIVDNALMAASEVLWTSTGRQFGKCTVKLRPCQKVGCDPCGNDGNDYFSVNGFGWGAHPWTPALENGVWTNLSCNKCGDTCGCKALCETPLPYPVCCIDEVKVGGTVLGRHLYDIINFKTLIRNSGNPVRTTLTGLNTVATGDTVMPTITVSGPGAAFPNPTTSGGELDDPNGCGVWLPTDGQFYTVQWSNNGSAPRQDVFLELCGIVGFPWEFDIAGIANGPIEVDSIDGDVTTTITQGGVAHVVVSPVTIGNAPRCVRVRILNNTAFQQILVRPTNTGGQGMAICAVQWSDTLAVNGQCWPKCQDLLKEDTEPDTYSITVTYGREVPEIIKMATASLACEFIKNCVGQPCALPQRIQSISRQGITIGLLDPMSFLAQGHTGIYIVDLAINRYNPKGLLKQASVYNLDQGHRWTRLTGKDC